jgi:hypothetical protein
MQKLFNVQSKALQYGYLKPKPLQYGYLKPLQREIDFMSQRALMMMMMGVAF